MALFGMHSPERSTNDRTRGVTAAQMFDLTVARLLSGLPIPLTLVIGVRLGREKGGPTQNPFQSRQSGPRVMTRDSNGTREHRTVDRRCQAARAKSKRPMP